MSRTNSSLRDRRSWWSPDVRRFALCLVLIAATHAGALWLIVNQGPLAPVWPPVGIALAALSILPTSYRRPMFVAYALIDTVSNAAQGVALNPAVLYLAVSLGELIAADALVRRSGGPFRFEKVRDVVRLLLITATVASLGSFPAALIAQADGAPGLLRNAIIWWVGDMLAFLVFTPFMVLMYHRPPSMADRSRSRWLVELVGLALLMMLAALFTARGSTLGGVLELRPYMLILPFVLVALRFGQLGSLWALLGVGATSILMMTRGEPIVMAPNGGIDQLTAVQLFLGVCAISTLMLATALREARDSATANARMVDALRESEQRVRQSQKMEAIGQLAGGVAHDFNNVLAAVVMQLGELKALDGLSATARTILHEIEDAVERATRLTRQLLVFSRQQAMQLRPTDVNALAQGHWRLLRRVVPNEVELRLEPSDAPIVVEADGGMIEQVLLNFVLNARDAIAPGGTITLTVQTAHQAVDTEDLAAGDYAVLTVRDTGHGIADEHLPRLFEPFFTTKPAGKGTGLGLATAHGIARQHGGTIRAESSVGAGTSMALWLPRSDAEVTPAFERYTPTGGTPVPTPERAHILVVEDEPQVRRLMQRLLERAGFEVDVAESGREALDRWPALAASVDLVLTDMVMPAGVSGTQLAARLREIRPDLPVVFTSGFDPGYDPADGTLVPGENFIAKPARAEQVLAVVRRQLGRQDV